MVSVYFSTCIVDVRWEVAQRIAVASRKVLCTSFSLYSSACLPDSTRCVSIRSRDTGMSNSKHDLHSSAFSLPWETWPKLVGGAACHRGRTVAAMPSRIAFKSSWETLTASSVLKADCSWTISCTIPSPMMSREAEGPSLLETDPWLLLRVSSPG